MIEVTPVILCGGVGTRLWPLSRSGFPKQFLCITGQDSLFQQAAARVTRVGIAEIVVSPSLLVMGEEHRFLAVEQLHEVNIPLGRVLLEPLGRNTAPALTLAALAAQEHGRDPVLLVISSDQTVGDNFAFTEAVQRSIREAALGNLVILGIKPDSPETGYRYIQAQKDHSGTTTALPVKRFVEKPDESTAVKYLRSGDYFWSAGIFVLKASVWIKALQQLRPDILEAARKSWDQRREDGYFTRPEEDAFKSISAESIDFAVMERGPDAGLPIKMVPLNAGWSDLGTWEAVWKVLDKDIRGNAQVGDVLTSDCHNTLVHATSRLVTLVGVQDLIVIETPDALLVVKKQNSQDVKHIVQQLAKREREEQVLHRKVHRPWGWYDCLDEGGRFKVKRIQVKPGASLSLQKHRYRAEHWVVVSGTAEIICGDKKMVLTENQSTFIPLGEAHRLANPGDAPLEIIEVQSGSYLGEDDILRLTDNYGRA